MLKIPDKAGTIYAKYPDLSQEYQFANIINIAKYPFLP